MREQKCRVLVISFLCLNYLYTKQEEKSIRNKMMIEALESLKSREKDIIIKRRLTDAPKTLEELSQEYQVSRERIRQIETRAFEKKQVF